MNIFFRKKQYQRQPMIPFSEFSASKEKRMKPERKAMRSFPVIPMVLWVLFLSVLVYVLLFSLETAIRNVIFSGNQTISVPELNDIVSADMDGKYLHIFPKNNFFLFSRGRVIFDIENISPKIRSVRIEKIFPETVSVQLEERSVVVVWRSADEDFLLNEQGFAVYHPQIVSVLEDPSTVILFDEVGKETKAGDMVMEASGVTFISEYMRAFESRMGRRLSSEIRIPSRFSGELLFRVDNDFDMLVDSHQPIDDTLMTFQAAMDRGIPDSDRDRLERIDLRTTNKVYYTVKEE